MVVVRARLNQAWWIFLVAWLISGQLPSYFSHTIGFGRWREEVTMCFLAVLRGLENYRQWVLGYRYVFWGKWVLNPILVPFFLCVRLMLEAVYL